MAELKKDVQIFILQQLACYRTPTEIIEMVKENFDGVSIVRQQIYYYQTLVKTEPKTEKTRELVAIFKKMRDQYDDNLITIPMMNASRRIEVIEFLILKEIKKPDATRNDNKILDLVTFISKEVGGMHTNKREVTVVPSTVQMARQVYNGLMSELSFTPEEAMAYVQERYNVEPQEISEANN